jgi:hypothetical protein
VVRAFFVIRHLYIGHFSCLASHRVDFKIAERYKENMLHLVWYITIGFLAGCVAKALLHTHLSITWTIVLGIVGSIMAAP